MQCERFRLSRGGGQSVSGGGRACGHLGDEIVYVDSAALADAVTAILCLKELARRPAQLTKHRSARSSEREALASGENRQQEDGRRASGERLEGVHEALPFKAGDRAVENREVLQFVEHRFGNSQRFA